jgi:3-oxoadipate enol-lactonase
VLLHSLGTDHRLWRHQIKALSSHHRVLAPDSSGHGASGWAAPLTVRDWTDDLDRVLAHAGVRGAVLAGISMGGVQAMAYAVHHPEKVRGLVIADSFAELPPEVVAARITGLADRARAEGMAALADFYVDSTFVVDPVPPGAEDVRKAIAGMDPGAYIASTETCFGARLGESLSGIDVPALVLWGELDEKTPRQLSERIAEAVPKATLETISAAGHLSTVENPDEVTRLLADFTDGLGK